MTAGPTRFIALLLALVACDLGAKAFVRWFLHGADVELGPFLALRLRFNEGSTFGLLPVGVASWVTLGIVVFVVAYGWWASSRSGWAISLGAAFVGAGGIGNLSDRWIEGRVTDFIALRVGQWHLPIFNLADFFLILGVVLLLNPKRSLAKSRSEP